MGKSRCSVCNHPERLEIEEALIKGLSIRKAADKYNLSAGAVGRHRKNCLTREVAETFLFDDLPEAATFDKSPTKFLTGEDVLTQLHGLMNDARDIFNEERKDKESSNMLALKALESINKFTQTYVSFMDLAQKSQEDTELKEWRIIAAYMWEFVEEKGLRSDFETGLINRGISFDR